MAPILSPPSHLGAAFGLYQICNKLHTSEEIDRINRRKMSLDCYVMGVGINN